MTTHHLLGCQIAADQWTVWEKLLIREVAPFFFSDGITLPDEWLILSHKAFSAAGFDLAFHDSYTTYRVGAEAQWVAMLTAAQFDSLLIETQQQLLIQQVKHRRGQVYPWEQIEKFFPESQSIESRCVTIEDKPYLVLDTKVWNSLTEEQRQQWLTDVLKLDTPSDCLSSVDATRINHPIIQQLAGTFAPTSGPNCFSTTLAAITHDTITARTIADFWLHQEPFFQGLARRGYTQRPDLSITTPDLRDAVLIWHDAQGQSQHACYLIEDELVLNKNSQAWFSPRQLLQLQTVLDVWQEYDYDITIYTR